ncbi:MAG: hypothetical protein HY850_05085 [Betaproteobacteria bacterium]|nr:hypothetical protein [Betaproteobacteria bacterium]
MLPLLVLSFGGCTAWAGTNAWTKQSEGLGPGAVHALAIDMATPGTLYAGTTYILASVDGSSPTLFGGGVFKSTDGGAAWTATKLTNTSVSALAINPLMPANLHAGAWRGVSKSMDSGMTWATVGMPAAPQVAALAIDPAVPDTLYVGTYRNGVLKSVDGGTKWNAANSGLTHMDVRALAIDPSVPNILYAGTSEGGVLKSVDGGTKWAAVNTGLMPMDVPALAIDPSAPNTIYAGTGGDGIFKSTDGGATWVAVNAGLPMTPTGKYNHVYTLAINPATPTTLYAGTNFDGVFKSTDSGMTWTNIGLAGNPVLALAIKPTTQAIVYAGTLHGVFRYDEASIPVPAVSDSDRIFNYLEAIYPQYLLPAKTASATSPEYYYRYYSGTNAYLATVRGMVYYLGPASGNSIHLVGTQADLLGAAAKAGF